MRLMIDANILLDVLMQRTGFYRDSSLIWKLSETRQAQGLVSVLTFANLVYIMRKELSPAQIRSVREQLSLIFTFADLTSADLQKASALLWDDFEDALQAVTAQRLHAEYIVTRNPKDFAASSIPAITPSKLLPLLRLQRYQEAMQHSVF